MKTIYFSLIHLIFLITFALIEEVIFNEKLMSNYSKKPVQKSEIIFTVPLFYNDIK